MIPFDKWISRLIKVNQLCNTSPSYFGSATRYISYAIVYLALGQFNKVYQVISYLLIFTYNYLAWGQFDKVTSHAYRHRVSWLTLSTNTNIFHQVWYSEHVDKKKSRHVGLRKGRSGKIGSNYWARTRWSRISVSFKDISAILQPRIQGVR